MIVVHSRLALNWHIAVIMRSVTTPRHGREHSPRLPRLLGAGPNKKMCKLLFKNEEDGYLYSHKNFHP